MKTLLKITVSRTDKLYTGAQWLRIQSHKKYFKLIVVNYNGSIIQFIKDIKNAFENNYIDVVMANDLFLGGLFAYWFTKDKPLVIRCGGEFEYDNPFKHFFSMCIQKYLLNKKDIQLIVNSKYLRNKIGGVFIPNGVDTSIFKEDKTIIKNDRILYVGRLEESKGLHVLINAINKCDDLKLDICGSGSMEIKENDKIKYLGNLNAKELVKQYQSHKILVFPAFSKSGDSMPNVILEAMACGCTVIANKNHYTKYIMENGFTGIFLNKQNDINSIVYAIDYLIKTPKLQEYIKNNALKNIQDNYTLKNYDFLSEYIYSYAEDYNKK